MWMSKARHEKLLADELANELWKQKQHDARRTAKEAEDVKAEDAREEKRLKWKAELDDQCKMFRDSFNIGGQFLYLDILFVVVGISTTESAYHRLGNPARAVMTCEYIGPKGTMDRRNFPFDMLPVLTKAIA